jgi:SAM-dependent methyltransferase
MKMDQITLKQRLKDYTFFHTIQLGDGIETPGKPVSRHKRLVLQTIANQDLEGKRVLDIGCANGLFSFEAERHGATDILAVDHTESQLEPLRDLLIPYLDSKIKVLRKNLLDLRRSEIGQFDIVIFPGVLYHLRYPFWSLKIVRDLLVEGGLLILETAVIVDDDRHAMLWCPSPADSPYTGRGANSCSFFNSKALREALASLGIDIIDFRHSGQTDVNWLRRAVRKSKQAILRTFDRGKSQRRRHDPKLDRVVLLCRRKSELVNPQLQEFYNDVS